MGHSHTKLASFEALAREPLAGNESIASRKFVARSSVLMPPPLL
jgi:hypothetical protein